MTTSNKATKAHALACADQLIEMLGDIAQHLQNEGSNTQMTLQINRNGALLLQQAMLSMRDDIESGLVVVISITRPTF